MIVLSEEKKMSTGVMAAKHLSFPLTINVLAADFGFGGVFMLGALESSVVGEDSVKIFYDRGVGNITVVNNGAVVYGIAPHLKEVAVMDLYAIFSVIYVVYIEMLEVLVKVNGEEICNGRLFSYDNKQNLQKFSIGGDTGAFGEFKPMRVRIFDEDLSFSQCV